MPSPTYTKIDQQPSALSEWQLASGLVAAADAQTAISAAKLSQSIRTASFVEAIAVLPVTQFGKIAMQAWGAGSDTETAIFELYGWSDRGPGYHMGQVTATLSSGAASAANTGFHTDSHKSIVEAFDKGTAYLGADIYADGADYTSAITVHTAQADFPDFFMIDFTNLQFKYLGIVPVTINSTNIATIFRPLSLKRFVPQLTS